MTICRNFGLPYVPPGRCHRAAVGPGNAVNRFCTLEVLVNRVDFESVIPTFLDLVEYPVPRVVSAADFLYAAPDADFVLFAGLLLREQDNFSSRSISTHLMQEVQLQALLNFQVRFGLQALASLSVSPSTSAKAGSKYYPRLAQLIKFC